MMMMMMNNNRAYKFMIWFFYLKTKRFDPKVFSSCTMYVCQGVVYMYMYICTLSN